MASIFLNLLIATTIWHSNKNCMLDAKVHSRKDDTDSWVIAQDGKTLGERYDRENYVWNDSLSELQLIQANEDIVFHHAAWKPSKGTYHGLKATLNVYRLPEVGIHQMSSTSIYVANDEDSSLSYYNGLQAGWHVVPALYGDREPHFYIYWKVPGRKAGCYNLRCKGFVYMNATNYTPGSRISPVSKYDGPQYEFTVKIAQDPDSGDWWVYCGRESQIPVGYWPKPLLSNIAKGADFLQWGGFVSYRRGEKGPPMGSGHFPKEGKRKAAYIKDVEVTVSGDLLDPIAVHNIEDKKDCYKAGKWTSNQEYFGGPSGCID